MSGSFPSLSERAHTLWGNSSQLLLFLVLFFRSPPLNSHDHEWMETEQFIESFALELISFIAMTEHPITAEAASVSPWSLFPSSCHLLTSTGETWTPLLDAGVQRAIRQMERCWSLSVSSSWRSLVQLGQGHQQNQGQLLEVTSLRRSGILRKEFLSLKILDRDKNRIWNSCENQFIWVILIWLIKMPWSHFHSSLKSSFVSTEKHFCSSLIRTPCVSLLVAVWT